MGDFNCPTCESDETQNVVAIVNAETQHQTGTFFGSGRLRDQGGDYADTQISGSTSEVSRSQLAIRLAPPDKKTWLLKALFVAGLVYFKFDYFSYIYEIIRENPLDWKASYDRINPLIESAITSKDYLLLGTLAGCVVLTPLAVKNFLYNILVYDNDYMQWEKKWYCHRCGSTFAP